MCVKVESMLRLKKALLNAAKLELNGTLSHKRQNEAAFLAGCCPSPSMF